MLVAGNREKLGGDSGRMAELKGILELINWIQSIRLRQEAFIEGLGGGVRKGRVHNPGFSVLNKFFSCFGDSYQIVFET